MKNVLVILFCLFSSLCMSQTLVLTERRIDTTGGIVKVIIHRVTPGEFMVGKTLTNLKADGFKGWEVVIDEWNCYWAVRVNKKDNLFVWLLK